MIPPLQDAQSDVTNFPIKWGGKIGDKMGFLSRKNVGLLIGMVALFGSVCLSNAPTASAQIATPTPLPQVVATRQAADNAAAQVNDLQAQRAQTEARLAEINRNIEAQIAEAERAAADARNAAATQNAVEAGAAIGRLEGALAQLRQSYSGKDAIIDELTARVVQNSVQNADDKRTIDKLTLELQQANNDKQTALNAYNAVMTQQATSQMNDMVGNAVYIIAALSLLSALIVFAVWRIDKRRNEAPVVVAPPVEDDVIESEVVKNDTL